MWRGYRDWLQDIQKFIGMQSMSVATFDWKASVASPSKLFNEKIRENEAHGEKSDEKKSK